VRGRAGRLYILGLAFRVPGIDVVIRVAGASAVSYGRRVTSGATGFVASLLTLTDEPTRQRRCLIKIRMLITEVFFKKNGWAINEKSLIIPSKND